MNSPRHHDGHVLVPTLAIGSLALVLAAGLGFLGLMDRANDGIAALLKFGGPGATTRWLADWQIWLGGAAGAFGISLAILSVAGDWRRMILWLTAMVVMAGWGPVLALASYAPELAVPLLATFWSGLCALIYASRHHMAVDDRGGKR